MMMIPFGHATTLHTCTTGTGDQRFEPPAQIEAGGWLHPVGDDLLGVYGADRRLRATYRLGDDGVWRPADDGGSGAGGRNPATAAPGTATKRGGDPMIRRLLSALNPKGWCCTKWPHCGH